MSIFEHIKQQDLFLIINEQLIEAKTAVILLKNSRLCTKNEYTQWLLKILYQPCSRKETEVNIRLLNKTVYSFFYQDDNNPNK